MNLLVSCLSCHSDRLTHVGFLHLIGCVYLNCWATGSDCAWQSLQLKTPWRSSGRTSVVRVTAREERNETRRVCVRAASGGGEAQQVWATAGLLGVGEGGGVRRSSHTCAGKGDEGGDLIRAQLTDAAEVRQVEKGDVEIL